MTRSDGSPRILLAALAAYALALVAAQGTIAVFEDEVILVVNAATTTLRETAASCLRGESALEHPPLYDLLLRGWILATGGRRDLLRLPSVAFWCAGLWLLGRAAGRAWGRRWPTVAIGMAWPLAPCFALPAHWGSLAFLLGAGLLDAYLAWLAGRRDRALVAATAFGIALVYTSHFGWAILAVLAVHAVAQRPGAAALRRMAACGAIVVACGAPLAPELIGELRGGTRILRSPTAIAADAAYHGWALVVSEWTAPWAPPAAAGAAGLLLLAVAAARARPAHGMLAVLGALFVAAVAAGILNGKRLVLFGPFLLLALGGVARHGPRGLVIAGLVLAFGTGWAGAWTRAWPGTFRYVEPWDAVVRETLARARPGDVVVCDHPSFWFHARDALGWSDWSDALPAHPIERNGITFTRLPDGRRCAAGADRVVYVKTAVNPWLLDEQRRIDDALDAGYRRVSGVRYLEDRAAAWKNRFVGNQPPWRIEIREMERVKTGP